MAHLFSRCAHDLPTSSEKNGGAFRDCGGRGVRRGGLSAVPRPCGGSAGGRRQRVYCRSPVRPIRRRKPRPPWRWRRRLTTLPRPANGRRRLAGTAQPPMGATGPQEPGDRCGRGRGGQPGAIAARRDHPSARQAQQAAPGPDDNPRAAPDHQRRDGQAVQGLALRAGGLPGRHAVRHVHREVAATCWTSSAGG